jgi:hypothetical protein
MVVLNGEGMGTSRMPLCVRAGGCGRTEVPNAGGWIGRDRLEGGRETSNEGPL